MKLNVVGDITGFAQTIKALIKAMPAHPLWALGDLIDRGPASKEVLDLFIDMGFKSIMGNHEHMMLFEKIRNNPGVNWALYPQGCWLRNGGYQTLDSFGVEKSWEFDPAQFTKYFDFLESLPLKHEEGNLILTHAPVSDRHSKRIYDIKDINNDPYLVDVSVLWNRHAPTKQEGKFQVYGHNSSKGILWHTDKHPQGIYMHDPLEVPEGAWAVCIDTWSQEYLTGLSIDTDLLANPKEAIEVYKQPVIDPFDFEALRQKKFRVIHDI